MESLRADINLINGDCLEVMKEIHDKSIDAIITDPPYGTTACKWDSVIPFEPMWERLNKLIKPNGVIVLFGSEPFSSALRMSNIKNYKYDWVWVKDKSKCINFLHANNNPLRQTENIIVFSEGSIAHRGKNKKRMEYNPQGLIRIDKKVKGNNKGGKNNEHTIERPSHKKEYIRKYTNYPTNILEIKTDFKKQLHPTQKPVALMEYLIKTYTNEGETVLDFTIGSGTTAIACMNTNRNFIGIELDEYYFNIAMKRVKEHTKQLQLWNT